MKILLVAFLIWAAVFSGVFAATTTPQVPVRQTTVTIHGDQFLINGQPTYPGRSWRGHRIEGLLLNSRMVQGVFDDANPETVKRWAYPDTGQWDPVRNTREFVAAMSQWRSHGLLAFTLNLQGGSPQGYSKEQPWLNSAFAPDGRLLPAYLDRLTLILNEADRLGMVVILGFFYFGQDERLPDEAAVIRAVDNATHWILDQGYGNVLVEVDNECDIKAYDHPILKASRIAELITRIKNINRDHRRLLVGTSYAGGVVPEDSVLAVSDFALVHGNGPNDPPHLRSVIRDTRARPAWHQMPVVVNEDDHFDFDQADHHFLAALGEYASWGYFDPGQSNYTDGYQCPPVNWGINTPRKKEFFQRVAEITGATQSQP